MSCVLSTIEFIVCWFVSFVSSVLPKVVVAVVVVVVVVVGVTSTPFVGRGDGDDDLSSLSFAWFFSFRLLLSYS